MLYVSHRSYLSYRSYRVVMSFVSLTSYPIMSHAAGEESAAVTIGEGVRGGFREQSLENSPKSIQKVFRFWNL